MNLLCHPPGAIPPDPTEPPGTRQTPEGGLQLKAHPSWPAQRRLSRQRQKLPGQSPTGALATDPMAIRLLHGVPLFERNAAASGVVALFTREFIGPSRLTDERRGGIN